MPRYEFRTIRLPNGMDDAELIEAGLQGWQVVSVDWSDCCPADPIGVFCQREIPTPPVRLNREDRPPRTPRRH